MINKSKIWIIAILILIALPMVNATIEDIRFPAQQNTAIDIIENCFNNNTYCSDTATCNITIKDQTQVVIINNLQMTNQVSYHNYTLSSYHLNNTGVYEATVMCKDGAYNGFDTFNFEVTEDGKIFNSVNFSMGIGIMLIGILFFILYLSNSISEDHALFKLFLNSMCVFLVMPIIWVARSIANLYSTSIANLIYLIYWGYGVIVTVFAFYLFLAFFIWLIKVLLKIRFDKDVEDDDD